MKIVKQSVEIIDLGCSNGIEVLNKLEKAGRTCYKSETNITEDSSKKFIEMIIKRGHESVLEHHNITIKFITDRGVTHEIVRHRIASYSQESTRYCNYAGKDMEFILPTEFYNKQGESISFSYWCALIRDSEKTYNRMIENGCTPQVARSVLPNSLKTEIVMTANIREWRHFFKLRCAKAAHPQMRELALMALNEVAFNIPVVFSDLWDEFRVEYA